MNHAMALQHICRHRCVHDVPLRGIFDDFNMQNIGQAHEAPLSGNKRIAMPSYYRSSKRGAPHNSPHSTESKSNITLLPRRKAYPYTPS